MKAAGAVHCHCLDCLFKKKIFSVPYTVETLIKNQKILLSNQVKGVLSSVLSRLCCPVMIVLLLGLCCRHVSRFVFTIVSIIIFYLKIEKTLEVA